MRIYLYSINLGALINFNEPHSLSNITCFARYWHVPGSIVVKSRMAGGSGQTMALHHRYSISLQDISLGSAWGDLVKATINCGNSYWPQTIVVGLEEDGTGSDDIINGQCGRTVMSRQQFQGDAIDVFITNNNKRTNKGIKIETIMIIVMVIIGKWNNHNSRQTKTRAKIKLVESIKES